MLLLYGAHTAQSGGWDAGTTGYVQNPYCTYVIMHVLATTANCVFVSGEQ